MRTPELFGLKARTIAVTGATGGLGIELCQALMESGSDVVCLDLAEEAPVEISDRLEEIAKQSGTRVSFFQCDVADISSVERAFEDAMRKARYPLRGLLTCAGVLRTGETTTFAAADSKIQLDINTLGTFQCAQVAARYVLRDNVSASFVFIGSLSGYIANSVAPSGIIPNAMYSASKAAVIQLGRTLAAEWGALGNGQIIRVNTLSPGYIMAPMLMKWMEDNSDVPHKEVWSKRSMLGRLSEAQDYRGPTVFLLSDASGFVTGTDLLVDGGHSKW